METKLKISLITLLLSLNLFSQTDTSKVCISYSVAHKIAVELIQKDSLQAELRTTLLILNEYKTKSSFQDSIITTQDSIIIIYEEKIVIYKEKEKLHQDKIKELEEKNSQLESKNKTLKSVIKWTGGALVGIIVTSLAIIATK